MEPLLFCSKKYKHSFLTCIKAQFLSGIIVVALIFYAKINTEYFKRISGYHRKVLKMNLQLLYNTNYQWNTNVHCMFLMHITYTVLLKKSSLLFIFYEMIISAFKDFLHYANKQIVSMFWNVLEIAQIFAQKKHYEN